MDHIPNATQFPMSWPQRQRAFADFAQGLISQSVRHLRPKVSALYERRAGRFKGAYSREPATSAEVGDLLDDDPLVRYLRFVRRKSQEMLWVSAEALVLPQEEALKPWLDESTGDGGGVLELDPNLEIPAYYFRGSHHQPGGFAGHALSGVVYETGLAIAFAGLAAGSVADRVPQASYRRILDLGCGTGRRTTEPFAVRYPQAEVWGLDASGPLLKVAHKRAIQRGLAISYRQALAEDTRFPDGHFDLVSATILMHEVPDSAAVQVLRETYRILAPGGLFAIGDELLFAQMTPYERWYDEWQMVHNNEPYWAEAKSRDMVALCQEAGFAQMEEEHRGTLRFFGERRAQWPPYLLLASKPS